MLQTKSAGIATYRNGKTDRVNLETGFVNTRLFLEITATFINGGAAAVGPLAFASILGIIQSSRIVLDYDQDFMRMSGLDLMARFAGDNGFTPSTVPALPTEAGEYTATFPIEFWAQNSSQPHLTAMDLRRIKDAQIEFQFGSVAALYENAGGMEIESLTINVVQESHMKYKRKLRVPKTANQPEGYINQFMRDYLHSEKVFDGAVNDVEIGVISADASLVSQGFIMYAHNGQKLEDLITGEIKIMQGSTTIATTTAAQLAARMEVLNRGSNVTAIHQNYWSGLLDAHDDELVKKWGGKDIVIKGSVSAPCMITTKLVGYRQERAKKRA